MRDRDPETFTEFFGAAADGLIDVTTASGARSAESPPRGARVQPVDGADLSEEPWTSRFRQAGDHSPFQEVQLDMASSEYLDPMLQFCHYLGLDTDRALAIVVDRAIQQGRGGARNWIMSAVGPIIDRDQLDDVLFVYGFSGVAQFQRSVPGLTEDGLWGPMTHAGLCWYERQRSDDDAFVIHVPSRDDMLLMMESASSEQRWGHRVARLRASTEFDDIPLSLLEDSPPVR